MGWKAKLVFGTKFVPWGLNQISQAKAIEPNLPNQTYKTESTRSNLPTKMFLMLRTKYTKPNLFNQTYKTKSIQLLLSNQIFISLIYRQLKLSPIPAWAELGPAQPQLVTFNFNKSDTNSHFL